MTDDDQSFEARFRRFYESCAPPEQAFLEGLFAAAIDAAGADDVTGFAGDLSSLTISMPGSEMSFDLQSMQMQARMAHVNRSYTIAGNIGGSKRSTVLGSLDDIR